MASTLTKDQREFLEQKYFDPSEPASYSGFAKFWKIIKKDKIVSETQAKNWLLQQDIYTSFFPKRGKFKRPQTVSPYKDAFWQADSAYMVAFQEDNDGFGFFVVFIDVFTRYVWTRALKSLKGREMQTAMEDIFQEAKCRNLYTDAGTEFSNRSVKRLLQDNDIRHFVARSDTKASMAERVIKTLKRWLYQYMGQKDTRKWVDVLPQVTEKYNTSVHTAIKMTPSQARTADRYDVWRNQFFKRRKGKPKKKRPKTDVAFKFDVGDTVKIVAAKKSFQREYDETFTTETFSITERFKKGVLSLYKIKDFNNQPIVGTFQDNELVKVIVPQDKTYRVDKVIRKRKRKGITEYLVSWRGWPKEFNSWVDKLPP